MSQEQTAVAVITTLISEKKKVKEKETKKKCWYQTVALKKENFRIL